MKKILILSNVFGRKSVTLKLLKETLKNHLEKEYQVDVIEYKDIMGDYPIRLNMKLKDFLVRFFKHFKLVQFLRKNKYDKIILTGNNIFTFYYILPVLIAKSKGSEIILFKYDLSYGTLKNVHSIKEKIDAFISQYLEKFFILKSDKIIHKGSKNELQFLPYSKKIKKPDYLFREFIEKKDIPTQEVKKISDDGEIHVVYVGGIFEKDFFFNLSIYSVIKKYVKSGVHFHFYSKIDKNFEKNLRELEKKNKYFHYEGFLPHGDMIKELQKYDFGSYLISLNNEITKDLIIIKTATGRKMYDYVTAGLPIVYTKDMLALNEFVNEFGIGVPIEKNEDIKKADYQKLKDNVKKAREKLIDTNKFMEFIR